MSLHIFISHCWSDKEFSAYKTVLNHLREKGHSVWLDKENMQAGDDTYKRMQEGIESCEVVVALISPAYEKSKACMFEYHTAKELGKTIVPCKIENAGFEDALKNVLYIDLCPKEKGFIDGFSALDRTLLGLEVKQSGNAVLKKEMEKNDQLWNELGDHETRMQKGVTGNAHSSVYISSSLKAMKELLAANPLPGKEDQRLEKFFADVEQYINRLYPEPWQDTVRTSLLAGLIDHHDPLEENAQLQALKQAVLLNSDPAVVRICICIARAQAHPSNSKAPEAFVRAIFFVPEMLNKVWEAGQEMGIANELRFMLDAVCSYYEAQADYVPDNQGYYGLCDDTFLALSYLHELNTACRNTNGKPLFDISLNQPIRAVMGLLPKGVAEALRQRALLTIHEAESAKLLQEIAGAVMAGWLINAAFNPQTEKPEAQSNEPETLEELRRKHEANQREWSYLHLKGMMP